VDRGFLSSGGFDHVDVWRSVTDVVHQFLAQN